MEQNQNTNMSQGSSLFQLNLDAQNSYTLRSAASWARVLGIVGIIMGILFFIVAIGVQQALRNYNYRSSGLSSTTLGNAGMAVYIVLGLIMVISSIFALNAGNKINQGLKANDQAALNSGFAGVRNYFALWSIIIIIMLLFIVLGILGNL